MFLTWSWLLSAMVVMPDRKIGATDCCKLQTSINFNQVRISLTVLSQLCLKYAYMLDILIHQFVHIEFYVDDLADSSIHSKKPFDCSKLE